MLNDHRRHPYRWQDRVISSGRTRISLISTALIAAIVGGAALFAHTHPVDTPRPAAQAHTERTPSLAESAKRPIHPSRFKLL